MDGGAGYTNPLDPQAEPKVYAKHVVLRTDRSDGFVGRNFLAARGVRARLLHRGDGRRPARQGQVLLGARLRPPELHDRPQRDPELRGLRRRRRGRLPRRGAPDGRVPRPERLSRAALQHRRPPLRPARLDARATRARWATPSASPRTTSTATPPGSRATRCRPPAIPATPPTGCSSTTTSSTRTTSTSTASSRRRSSRYVPDADRHRHRLAGHERRHHPRQPHLRQLAPRHGAGSRSPTRSPGSRRATSTRACTVRSRDVSTTSCGNRYHNNVMGRPPPGFSFNDAVDMFGNRHGAEGSASLPNGVDFWWDEFAGNNGNCWYDNTGADGTDGLDHRLRRGDPAGPPAERLRRRASATATS